MMMVALPQSFLIFYDLDTCGVWADLFVVYPFMPVSLLFLVGHVEDIQIWSWCVFLTLWLTSFLSSLSLSYCTWGYSSGRWFIHVSSCTKKASRYTTEARICLAFKAMRSLIPSRISRLLQLCLPVTPEDWSGFPFSVLDSAAPMPARPHAWPCMVYIIIVCMLQARRWLQTYRLAQGWQPDLDT